MIGRTFHLYRNAYSGLSSSTWWLSVVMLVNRSGTMVLPFMTIYLTSPSMGYSIGQAGLVMGVFGLGAVAGGYMGGRLTDRIGFHTVQLFTLLGGGFLFILLGQMKSFPLICLFTFLLSLINEAFRPANSTAIAHYSREENRTRSFSLNRLSINLGWAVGNALGGVLAAINYELLFWVDGLTNICAAILLWYFLAPTGAEHRPVRKADRPAATRSAYRDRIFLWFVGLLVLFAGCFFQFFTTLSAWYRNTWHFSQQFIGLLGAINGLIITFVEMVIVFKLEGRRHPLFYITRGVWLTAIGFGLFILFPVTHFLALVMIVIVTFGEILAMPFMNTFWISRTDPYNRGQYAGLYTIAWSIAQSAGPLLGAQVAEHAGFRALWWVVTGVCAVAAVGYGLLRRSGEQLPGQGDHTRGVNNLGCLL